MRTEHAFGVHVIAFAVRHGQTATMAVLEGSDKHVSIRMIVVSAARLRRWDERTDCGGGRRCCTRQIATASRRASGFAGEAGARGIAKSAF